MKDFAEKYRSAAFGLLVAATLLLSAFIILPFVPALLWATVLSILTYPVYQRIYRKLANVQALRKRDLVGTTASLLTTILTLLIIIVPFLLMGASLYGQLADFAQQITSDARADGQKLTVTGVMQQVDALIKPLTDRLGLPQADLEKYFRENGRQIAETVRQPLGNALKTVGYTVLTLVVALLTMFFMTRDAERLRGPAHDLVPLPPERTDSILKRVADTVFAVFIGTVLVAVVQGAIMGVTYAIFQVPNPVLLGFFSILLCIIPLLGAPVLYIPVGLVLIASGNLTGGLAVLGVGFLIVSQIDNVLKPILIGGRANLHPMATFFSVLGGVMFFGPVGLMAGPMVLAVLLALIEVLRERVHAGDDSPSPQPT